MTPQSDQSTTEKQIDNPGFSLDNILSGDHDSLEHPTAKDAPEGGWDEESSEGVASQGFCVECEGTQTCGHRQISLYIWPRTFQTSLHNYTVKFAEMIIVKSALLRSIARVHARDMQRSLFQASAKSEPSCRMAQPQQMALRKRRMGML